jgi:hypothetical protein
MLIHLRDLKQRDLDEIDRIWKESGHSEHFGLPALTNIITTVVADKDGAIIGFGLVKGFAEGIAILDLSKSKADRLIALEKLLAEGFRACEDQNIEHLHVFVQDPAMQRLLCQKFGFKIATGVALVKEF